MALSGSGTPEDPYQVGTVSDWNEIHDNETELDPKNFIFVSDIDATGELLTRERYYGTIDFDGFKLHNVEQFQFGSLFNSIDGTVKNGEIHVNVTTNDGGDEFIINELEGVCENMRFSGTITATSTGDAHVCRTLQNSSNGFVACVFDVDLTVVDGVATPVGQSPTVSAEKLLSTGTYEATGTGDAYGFTASSTFALSNSFFDSTKNSGLTDEGGATGKTTTELQDIDTYTDTATTGLSEAWDMVTEGSYVDEAWAIDDGNAYPILSWEVEVSSNLIGTAKILGVAESGVTAVFFEADDVELTNFNKLGTDTSDGSGNVTYTGTYDDTKHIGILWHKLEFDEADNPTVYAMVEWINGLDLTPPA